MYQQHKISLALSIFRIKQNKQFEQSHCHRYESQYIVSWTSHDFPKSGTKDRWYLITAPSRYVRQLYRAWSTLSDVASISLKKAKTLINVFECSFESDISLVRDSIKIEIIPKSNNIFWIVNSACPFHTGSNIFLDGVSWTLNLLKSPNCPCPELD